VDLEERTRGLFAAINAGPAQAILDFFAADAIVEAPGLLPPIGLAKFDPMLRRGWKPGRIRVAVQALKVKRNVAFAGWSAEGDLPGGDPGEMEGLLVVSWDTQGKVARADLHLGAEAAKRLKP